MFKETELSFQVVQDQFRVRLASELKKTEHSFTREATAIQTMVDVHRLSTIKGKFTLI